MGYRGSFFVEYLVVAVVTSLLVMSAWIRKFLIGRVRESSLSTWGFVEYSPDLTLTVQSKDLNIE